MRLINIKTLQLRVFVRDFPEYVIVSHRWHEDPAQEATLQRYQAYIKSQQGSQRSLASCDNGSPAKDAPNVGIMKVLAACQIAIRRRVDWLWIDTVCIDKTNNVELSEAINSMYDWYRRCEHCLVYLHDVVTDTESGPGSLGQSEWFKRGWTLQELIAPASMMFFDSKWHRIGTKDELKVVIHGITGIPVDVISNAAHASMCCVAQRMSWAAMRKTTREEDIAYCLLGLFDISMELLYGEGAEKAFRRLQLKILEEREDESILSWSIPEGEMTAKGQMRIADESRRGLEDETRCAVTGLLATMPRHFADRGSVKISDHYVPDTPIRVTSRGIDMPRDVMPLDDVNFKVESLQRTGRVLVVPIACSRSSDHQLGRILIFLAEDVYSKPVRRWCRVHIPAAIATHLVGMSVRKLVMDPLFVRVTWPFSEEAFARSGWQPHSLSFFTAYGLPASTLGYR